MFLFNKWLNILPSIILANEFVTFLSLFDVNIHYLICFLLIAIIYGFSYKFPIYFMLVSLSIYGGLALISSILFFNIRYGENIVDLFNLNTLGLSKF